MTRQAVILAGGLGTRLRTVIGDVPKALAEVGGRPVLGHQLDLCRRHDFTNVVLLLGHGAQAVQEYVGDGARFGLSCRSVIEDRPLGTAGAVLRSREYLRETFLVMYCDTMLDVDLDRFWRYAENKRALATLLVHPNDHPFDSDLVITDKDDRITGFSRWKEGAVPLRNLASAALYIVNRKILEGVRTHEGTLDFGRHVFPDLVGRGEALFAYRSIEYIKDLGTPERLANVNQDYSTGKVDPSRTGRLRGAVFLDRDGVLNLERNGVLEPSSMELLPGAAEGVKLLNNAGLATVVITNQPYVSHGALTEETLDAVHAIMERDLALGHAYIDAVYYCPHHPHKGYSGERAELKVDCMCRKPNPGMILRAAEDLGINLNDSWMVGDRTADIAAARRGGLRAILVHSGHGGKDGLHQLEPDFAFEDVREAADFITNVFPRMRAHCETIAKRTELARAQVFIGGRARSGKTTWSRVLSEVLRAQGRDHIVLSLDAWLKDLHQRGSGVLARYDLQAVRDIISRLQRASDPCEIFIPIYDRSARKRIGETRKVVQPGAIVICEGVPALALDVPGALRFNVAIDEAINRQRFDACYSWRGEILNAPQYWSERQIDEVSLIDALGATAEALPNFEVNNA
jgi:histidinol-phosphate phosphatase family protein